MWSVYKGDELLFIGTAEEVCRRFGWKRGTLHWLATPANRRRDRAGRRLVTVNLDRVET